VLERAAMVQPRGSGMSSWAAILLHRTCYPFRIASLVILRRCERQSSRQESLDEYSRPESRFSSPSKSRPISTPVPIKPVAWTGMTDSEHEDPRARVYRARMKATERRLKDARWWLWAPVFGLAIYLVIRLLLF